MSLDLQACSDGELATLTLAGRQAAFAEIMHRHQTAIFRLVRGMIGNAEESLDLTQDCFVSAFGHLRKYDGARPLRAWLSRIAINKCRDWRRRQKVRQLFTFSSTTYADEIEQVPDEAPSAHASAASKLELKQLAAAIGTLPASLREVLLLRTVEGLSQSEAATALSISGKAVETRLYRARARLAEILAEE
ncbi:RNA polymerase sigma factor [Novosphingobium lentum]|uniref:RNA polymerase sigma factor n=1 Tax=Novosphingobium lentum TaxID=145287 RepID=UPI0008349AFD|nr:RNA polymerase sigma factor [Novosphingobium lentum]